MDENLDQKLSADWQMVDVWAFCSSALWGTCLTNYQSGIRRWQAYSAENLSRLLSVIKKCNDQYRQMGQSCLHIERTFFPFKTFRISNLKRSRTMTLCPHVLSITDGHGVLGFWEMQCFCSVARCRRRHMPLLSDCTARWPWESRHLN